ncbi:MAG TPA: sialidase family protein [Gammaproteobacteria bacterium]|nr:sialidase family protein [Gammaproteobacteria bacterium]
MKLPAKIYPLLLSSGVLLASCGGGSSSSSSASATPPAALQPPASPLVRVSGPSPFSSQCGGALQGSTSYENAEVEPYVAVNPLNPSNLIGVWQQDRWSDGGAHGLMAGYSMDNGKTWKTEPLVMSICAGGDSSNAADYARASDPWVTFSPTGTAYAISISFSGESLTPTSAGGVLVTRSTDGGATWGTAQALIVDGASAFDDKESITADPTDSNYVYAVWDRLTTDGYGPTYFSRTTDGGSTWEAARAIYDPGFNNQTIGNVIVVTTSGTLVDAFVEYDNTGGNSTTATMKVIRSTDHGATWSTPITVAQSESVGVEDPNTGTWVRTASNLPQIATAPSNGLVMVWQDARFNQGKHDGIVISQSSDGGLTWSAPVEINTVHSVPAFTPSVAVLPDGTIGVSYFDFRNNTSDKARLLTDYWFVSSDDGVHWSEQHISGPFDLDLAPNAEGLFIGDYQSLGVIGNAFVPFYVQTNNEGTSNRNDTYTLPPQPVPLRVTRKVSYVAHTMPSAPPDAAFRQRTHASIMRQLRGENPGWDRILAERRQRLNPP